MSMFVYAPYSQRARRLMRQVFEHTADNDHMLVGFPVDIRAEEDAYELSAVIPGVKAEDITIQVVGDSITLEGEIKSERDQKAQYLRVERPSGKFHRTFTFPETLEAAKAEAHLADGILTLRVPKSEQARPKVIKVKHN